jgi:hypothetical protein
MEQNIQNGTCVTTTTTIIIIIIIIIFIDCNWAVARRQFTIRIHKHKNKNT